MLKTTIYCDNYVPGTGLLAITNDDGSLKKVIMNGTFAVVQEDNTLQNILILNNMEFFFEDLKESACAGFPYADNFEENMMVAGYSDVTIQELFKAIVETHDMVADFFEDGTYQIFDAAYKNSNAIITMGLQNIMDINEN